MKSTFLRVRPHTFGWILQRGNRALSVHKTFEQALDACLRLAGLNGHNLNRLSLKS